MVYCGIFVECIMGEMRLLDIIQYNIYSRFTAQHQ